MSSSFSSMTNDDTKLVGSSPANTTSISICRCLLWLPQRFFILNRYFICLALLMVVVTIIVVPNILPKAMPKVKFNQHHTESSAIMKLLTLPESFISARGAYCLDGSPPGYYYRPSQDNSGNWIIYLPGGAWCTSDNDCYERSKTELGSSRVASSTLSYDGFLSNSCKKNPDFCFWNVIVMLYCDGSSFLGNVSDVIKYKSQSLYLRGAPIFDALYEYILTVTHLGQAEQIIMAGSSAGGIGALIHADHLRSMLPKSVKTVHVIVDGSMFPDVPSVTGHNISADMFKSVYDTHNLKSSLSAQKCIREQSPGKEWRCLLPEVYHYYVDTPTFFINSVYDTWQRTAILQVPCSAGACPNAHTGTVYRTRDAIQHMARQIIQSRKNGVFLTSCPLHVSLFSSQYSKLKVDNSTIQNSVVSWLEKSSPTIQSKLFSWLQIDMKQRDLELVFSLEAGLKHC